ncbi:MAG: hypothetical protein ACYTEZ_12655 [Planctomycetota bacterium]|jgi:hypothetical protein
MVPRLDPEIVFSSPDPREAEEMRARLAQRGLAPRLAYGPDPVTGVGGELFGGAGGLIYNVSVPPHEAARAREVLSRLARPAAAVTPERERPPDGLLLTRTRRIARPALWLFLLLCILPIFFNDLVDGVFVGAVYVALAATAVFITHLLGRKSR